MGELRAYALAAEELRTLSGATGARRDQVRTLAQHAFAPVTGPLAVRDLLGPIHRRVPGQRVVRGDEPTPADLDTLLDGTPVPLDRAAATWGLVEAVVDALAWASVRLTDSDLPAGVLAHPGLPVPPVEGLTVGWCTREQAGEVPGLRAWLTRSGDWAAPARHASRPAPDVVCFARR